MLESRSRGLWSAGKMQKGTAFKVQRQSGSVELHGFSRSVILQYLSLDGGSSLQV